MNLDKRNEVIELLEKYKNFLSQTQLQAMMLYYFEDLSLAEIAAEVATTRSAVHDAIKKGEAKLRKIEAKMNG